MAPITYSIFNHVKSNLRGGISNLRIFDINPATKFEYRGKSNLVAPDLLFCSSKSLLQPQPACCHHPYRMKVKQPRRSPDDVCRNLK
jgi:hypothetical protein